VAASWFLAFSAHALIRRPEVRDRLADGDPVDAWGGPYAFRPERFLARDVGAFELVPQGGGDPRTGHRCPGEQLTVALLSALAIRLARLPFDVPAQDLSVSLRRIPARPKSGVVLLVRG
jgi:fatty-acid peroxygenase